MSRSNELRRFSCSALAILGLAALGDAQIPFIDNFSNYTVGVTINGQTGLPGGWKQWAGATNSTSLVESWGLSLPPNKVVSIDAVQNGEFSDLVHEITGATSANEYTVRVYSYMPSTTVDASYFLVMNGYADNRTFTAADYGVVLELNPLASLAIVNAGSTTPTSVSLIYDQWVEIRAEIDMPLDRCQVYYDGLPCGAPYTWTGCAYGSGGGALDIAAVDMYHVPATTAASGKSYWDDVAVIKGLPAAPPVVYCTAKINSLGCTPSIGYSGFASSTLTTGFAINTTYVRNNQSGVYIYSASGRAATAFQGGLLCLSGPIKKATMMYSFGSPGPASDCTGVYGIDMNMFAHKGYFGLPLPAAYLTVAGTVVQVQAWGPDKGFPFPNNSTLSDALEYTVGP